MRRAKYRPAGPPPTIVTLMCGDYSTRMAFDPPEELNLADYFLESRIREGKGERVALLCGDRQITYRDVQLLANRFGHVLRGLGVGPEQRVIIALPDGPEYVGALFGILT